MNKIGVIGATGMLGHHVAKAVVDSGNQLVVIHRAKSNLQHLSELKFIPRVASLDDEVSLIYACEDLDYVINCGAYYPTKPRPLKKEMAIAKRQIRNFIKAVKKSPVKKALYVGAAIALPFSDTGIADESQVYQQTPSNKAAYLQVKWLMDKLVREAGQDGVPIVIGIPAMTLGEWDYGPSTGRLVVHAANQTLPGFVEGNRNLVYAGDAARGLLLACLNGRPGERYLITGENITMSQLLEKVLQQMSIDTMPKKIPLAMAKLVSRIKQLKYKMFGGELPLLDDTAIAVMASGQFLDGKKAQKELGYQPQVSTDELISRTVKWFKDVSYIK